jgi:dGTPase
MRKLTFQKVSASPQNPKWAKMIERTEALYKQKEDIRTDFERDYTRILHSTAYRRLKHKTQVFFATQNDHICTRIEHVNHVVSISYTISSFLGLNTQLTNAIAIGHDLGHAPFGHAGESIIREIAETQIGEKFWHEKNSLRFIDKIETLQDPSGKERNLNLTYAVRDGIISHCGEVDEIALAPRAVALDLEDIKEPNQYSPYTWEGCIVKIADKVSYLGRDIEDAITLRILTTQQLRDLGNIAHSVKVRLKEINNTALMHNFIIDLCKSSKPDDGIRFSSHYLDFINKLKEFNYKHIYLHPRLEPYKDFADLIINSLYKILVEIYRGKDTLNSINRYIRAYPKLMRTFREWLDKYSNVNSRHKMGNRFENKVLYKIENEKDYKQSIVDFIAGMTDSFATAAFHELISF